MLDLACGFPGAASMHRIERIRHFAEISVRRGCGFAALAILTFMVGLSATPVTAFRTGAVLSTLLATVLFFQSLRSAQIDYRTTELWVLLDRRHDLPDPQAAKRVISQILKEVYLLYAERAAWSALGFWALSVAFWIAV